MYTFIGISVLIGILCIINAIKNYKNREEYNKEIKNKIKYGKTNYDTLLNRDYNESDYITIKSVILNAISIHFCLIFLLWIIIGISSIIYASLKPIEQISYSFNINSLQDNLVTKGEIIGTRYSVRGNIDGEIKYFYSRTMEYGENINSIPSNVTYIKYDDNVTPHIIVYKNVTNFSELEEKLLFIKYLKKDYLDHYELVVPNGTIETENIYDIDMK